MAIERFEVITGEARRRRWTAEDKRRVVAEVAAGASVAEVARRHDLCRSLVYRWRKQAGEGDLERYGDLPRFVPVAVEPAERPPVGEPSQPRREAVEVRLRCGRVLRVAEDIAPAVLGRLITAVEGA